MSDTPRTLGDLVMRDARLNDCGSTRSGLEMLRLQGTTHYQAANTYLAALAIIARQERELAAAQKDAERYRWLRDTANKADIQTALLGGLQPRFIDDAIDAAIAASPPPPHASAPKD